MRITDITSQDVVSVLTRVGKKYPKMFPLCVREAVLSSSELSATAIVATMPASTELLGSAFGPTPPPNHFRALPYRRIPAALARVRQCDAWLGPRVLFEFMVLTVVRTREARGALWSELDFETSVWSVPASRIPP